MGSDSNKSIVVVGAGVIGLSTAITLQRRFKGSRNITIVAAELPSLPCTWDESEGGGGGGGGEVHAQAQTQGKGKGRKEKPSVDYASMWAGAHYRPIARSTRQLEIEFELAVYTRDVMTQIARDVDVGVCGVSLMPAVELLEKPSSVEMAMKSGDIYAGEGDGFRIFSAQELEEKEWKNDVGNKVKWGCEYMSYCVNIHAYCCWLLELFVQNGGTVICQRLDGIEDAFRFRSSLSQPKMQADMDLDPDPDLDPIVVNCSGNNFGTDHLMKAIRGQTVLVKNPYHRTVTRQMSDGGWSFLIPRPGGAGTIVGGTKEIGDLQTTPRPETRKILLENAVQYFPDFVDDVSKFELLFDNVGRRPWREGGMRIEAEQLSPTKVVVHGYGAGGRGYELSWGAAEQISGLVEKALSARLGAKS